MADEKQVIQPSVHGLANEVIQKAVNELLRLLESKDESIRLAAAKLILDRSIDARHAE